MAPTSHLELVQANRARRQEIQNELRSIDEKATAEQRPHDENEAGRYAELRSEITAIDERITANLDAEIATRSVDDAIGSMLGTFLDRDTGDVRDVRDLSDRLTDSDAYRSFPESGSVGKLGVFNEPLDYRAVGTITTGSSSGGSWISNERLSRIGTDFLDRKTFLVDLLPHLQVSTSSVEIPWDGTPLADMVNKPTAVAEGTAKPQAGLTPELVTEPIRTIAVWWDLTRQLVADAPFIKSYMDQRGGYALKRTVDKNVVAGAGGAGLLGLTGRETLSHVAAGSEEKYVSIRKGLTEMEENESVGEIIVLNPADAEGFDLSNHADDGLHAVPNVAGPGARTAWGLTQVRTNAIAPGFALIIDPMQVAVLDRQQVSAYATDSDGEKFRSNILTFLMECRVGLGLFSPAGVCKVVFDGYSGSGSF